LSAASAAGLPVEEQTKAIQAAEALKAAPLQRALTAAQIAEIQDKPSFEEQLSGELLLKMLGGSGGAPVRGTIVKRDVNGEAHNILIDPITGEDIKDLGPAPDATPDGGKAVPTTSYNVFRKFLADEFLPVAIEYLKKTEPDASARRQKLNQLRDPLTGTIDPARLYSILPDEEKRNWARALSEYESAIRSGDSVADVFKNRTLLRTAPTVETREEFDRLKVGDLFIKGGRVYRKVSDKDVEIVQ